MGCHLSGVYIVILHRKDWQGTDYEKGDQRTIEKIIDFANNPDLSRESRMGVKSAPY